MREQLTLYVEHIGDAQVYSQGRVAYHTGEGMVKGMAGGCPNVIHLGGGGPIRFVLQDLL